MTQVPQDISDLYLAPVVLAIDARLTELGSMSDDDLVYEIALDSNLADWTAELRQHAVLRTVAYLTNLHGWTLEWDPRGVRLAHGSHVLVLGVPPNVAAYVAGTLSTGRSTGTAQAA